MNALIIVVTCLFLLLLSVSYLCISALVVEIQKLKGDLTKNVRENLELATTNQIMNEINRRESTPIILVKVTNQGVLVDCFHMPPALSIKVLEKASDLIRENIQKKMDGKDLYE